MKCQRADQNAVVQSALGRVAPPIRTVITVKTNTLRLILSRGSSMFRRQLGHVFIVSPSLLSGAGYGGFLLSTDDDLATGCENDAIELRNVPSLQMSRPDARA